MRSLLVAGWVCRCARWRPRTDLRARCLLHAHFARTRGRLRLTRCLLRAGVGLAVRSWSSRERVQAPSRFSAGCGRPRAAQRSPVAKTSLGTHGAHVRWLVEPIIRQSRVGHGVSRVRRGALLDRVLRADHCRRAHRAPSLRFPATPCGAVQGILLLTFALAGLALLRSAEIRRLCERPARYSRSSASGSCVMIWHAERFASTGYLATRRSQHWPARPGFAVRGCYWSPAGFHQLVPAMMPPCKGSSSVSYYRWFAATRPSFAGGRAPACPFTPCCTLGC